MARRLRRAHPNDIGTKHVVPRRAAEGNAAQIGRDGKEVPEITQPIGAEDPKSASAPVARFSRFSAGGETGPLRMPLVALHPLPIRICLAHATC